MLTLIRAIGGRNCEYRCECGKVVVKDKYNVQNGNTKSCGCMKSAMCAAANRTHGHKSGGSQTRAHRVWGGMKSRCLNKKCKRFNDYGGRGIKICDRWLGENGFLNFYADMGDPPPGCSIERVDNDLGYEPGNCKWATRVEQARNKRNVPKHTAFGLTMSAAEWADFMKMPKATIRMRLWRGASPEVAFREAKAILEPTVTAGNFTLTMPTSNGTTGLIRIA